MGHVRERIGNSGLGTYRFLYLSDMWFGREKLDAVQVFEVADVYAVERLEVLGERFVTEFDN